MTHVEVLANPETVARRFTSLAGAADRIRIATAWATEDTRAMRALAKNYAKVVSISVGISFGRTDPSFLRRFRSKTRVVIPAKNVTFHPKVYIFERGKRFDAIIGSSNLTSGGFETNLEANVLVSGQLGELFLKNLKGLLDDISKENVPVDRRVLAECERQRAIWKKLRANVGTSRVGIHLPRASSTSPHSPSLFVNWGDYYKKLLDRDGFAHNLRPSAGSRGYLGVIADIQQLFSKKKTLQAMTQLERERVAGLTRDDYGTFGSTYRVGHFFTVVRNSPRLIDPALSSIPPRPLPVTKQQFQTFVRLLPRRRGFGSSGVGSRLLSMKRPDVFVGVNGKNGPGLAREFGFAPTTLNTYSRYWQLHEAIWSCPWYRSPRPAGRQGEVWEARVALLDSLFYAE